MYYQIGGCDTYLTESDAGKMAFHVNKNNCEKRTIYIVFPEQKIADEIQLLQFPCSWIALLALNNSNSLNKHK